MLIGMPENILGFCSQMTVLTLAPKPHCVTGMQIATVNKAIGATSAVAMQCKGLVGQYLPEIVKAVQEMPLDQVSIVCIEHLDDFACLPEGRV